MNELQVIGTHNSYKREISAQERAKFDEVVGRPGEYDRSLAYSHAALRDQFERQDIRGLELDLFPDPAGGLYAQPFLRTLLGLGPLADPAWARPGIKVFHVADLDYATTCVAFVTCLQQVKSWSDDHPATCRCSSCSSSRAASRASSRPAAWRRRRGRPAPSTGSTRRSAPSSARTT
jgi:hypothetical protein